MPTSPAVPFLWIAGKGSPWHKGSHLLFYTFTPLKMDVCPEYPCSAEVCVDPEHKKIDSLFLLLYLRSIISGRNWRTWLLKGWCEPLWLDYAGIDSIPPPKAVRQTCLPHLPWVITNYISILPVWQTPHDRNMINLYKEKSQGENPSSYWFCLANQHR